MTGPAALPALTVRHDSTTRTFAPGNDVVVGRDLRADFRIAHPLISRAHLMLRFDHGRWVAVDNGSLNGIYVNGQRVPAADLHDGSALNIGNPDGPLLTFDVGHHTAPAGTPPTTSMPVTPAPTTNSRPSAAWPTQQAYTPPSAAQQRYPSGPQAFGGTQTSGPQPQYPSGPHPQYPSGPQQQYGQPPQPRYPTAPQQQYAPPSAPVSRPTIAAPPEESSSPATQFGPTAMARPSENNLGTTMLKILRPGRNAEAPAGAIKIGRATDNDIVIPDVLASRHHATLVPSAGGAQIIDNRSINGTFVNGHRVEEAMMRDGDVVTIGNVDLVYSGGTLARRTATTADTRTGGLEVHGLTWTIEGNKTLLNNISLDARPGTLTAVIGPSGAGKSTFSKQVAGLTHPTSGTVTFEGHDIHAEYASLRSRIGMVPQDDVVHGDLTVRQALMYAAELRLPPDTTKEDREQVVMQVLEELEMTNHLDTRVEKLSGGQRKRASVALELLTGPSLLILDEPTSGLDPALDRAVMTMLRQLADAGRVVLVVTHSLTYLDICDQVLLLAPGGMTAFSGPPSQIGPELGTTNWADIFSSVAGDPDEAHRKFLERTGPTPPVPAAAEATDLGKPAKTSLRRQFSTIARRQVRLVVADRAYTAFLLFLPFIMGVLSLSVPGGGPNKSGVGFGKPLAAGPPDFGAAPSEPGQILVMMNVGAIFMGTALTIRALIGERAIFRREQAVGLSTTAYLAAKVAVFTAFAIVQSSIVVAITIIGKGWGPGAVTSGAVIPGRSLEMFVDISMTCVAAAMTGLALSGLAKSAEQIMPLLVVAVMSQLVFSGGLIPVTGRVVLDQLSWLTPARWGFASSASTIDLTRLVPEPVLPNDKFWHHTTGAWWTDIGALLLLSACYLGFVRWRIRLKSGES
ncbi:ABC transporter ATP-binding protein [Mycobacterium sp. CBMA 213]|uniref:FHA domain-containing protein n=1 Tax=Mycolicibacterium sp. CBMA 213 TaxID=1968788 RepID=UPI0012DEDF3F|nr:FHA domain-containing protein [Mycolicibacterium sp. CBMA 213]MUM08360.1 ABC transporter ATP-binding protein [Mycolicibacterium sp. CBMA 213]